MMSKWENALEPCAASVVEALRPPPDLGPYRGPAMLGGPFFWFWYFLPTGFVLMYIALMCRLFRHLYASAFIGFLPVFTRHEFTGERRRSPSDPITDDGSAVQPMSELCQNQNEQRIFRCVVSIVWTQVLGYFLDHELLKFQLNLFAFQGPGSTFQTVHTWHEQPLDQLTWITVGCGNIRF